MTYKESVEGGYVGVINEVEGVTSQGETLEELRTNLREALLLYFEIKKLAGNDILGEGAKHEYLQIAC